METIFMNAENSQTNQPHRFRLASADKRNLLTLIKLDIS